MLLRNSAGVDADAGFTCHAFETNEARPDRETLLPPDLSAAGGALLRPWAGPRHRADAGRFVRRRPPAAWRRRREPRWKSWSSSDLAGQVVYLLKHQRFRRLADEFRLPLVLLLVDW
jgi:hypothetical protein